MGNPWVNFPIPLPIPANTIPAQVRVQVHHGNSRVHHETTWVHCSCHGVTGSTPLLPNQEPLLHRGEQWLTSWLTGATS
jgi:hypothetical protein